MRASILIIILWCFSAALIAQSFNEKLALQYATEGDCEKANSLFNEMLVNKTASQIIYLPYLKCLEQQKNYSEARKVCVYFFERYRNISYQVDEAYYYEQDGEAKKSKKILEKLVESEKQYSGRALTLSLALKDKNYFNYALDVLEKNRELYNDPNLHGSEIASLYYRLGQKDKALNMILDWASWDEASYNMILAQLPGFMNNPEDYAMVKSELIKRIRSGNNGLVYEEILSWVFVQQKDWNSAFIHYKSISIKKNDRGYAVLNLANLCNANRVYDVSVKCYEYIMGLGKTERFYSQAKAGWLEARYKDVLSTPYPDSAKLEVLELDFNTFINENKNNPFASKAMRQLAEIYVKQLHKPTKAISLLEEVIKTPYTAASFRAECKLDLGDAYLFMGDVWESELLYAQVEKDFKEEPLGQEAKFRKARLAYFRGEFEWAETQLEVLKGATTQLIANNAIELALTIQDNLGLDSNYVAMEAYANAQLLLFQNKNQEALKEVEKIGLLFPKHSLVDEVIYMKARVNANNKDWDKAISFYQLIIKEHANDILYDNALFELASIYENQLKDTVNAMLYYEELILKQPGSLFTVEASRKYRVLRGDVIKEQENYYFEN